MELYFRDFGGEDRLIVILHGLFGSSKNWVGVGRFLTAFGRCYALDLRNHGDSPHARSHSLQDLIGDLGEWLDVHGEGPPILIGHSMGGLAAMGYALKMPERVRAIVVVDIAPRVYPYGHRREFEALKIDISACATRPQIDEQMRAIIPAPEVRRFLQMNIARTGDGFRWKLNVQALERSTVNADVAGLKGEYTGRALFIAGERSGYVRAQDHRRIMACFPNASIDTLPDADHWLHYSAADAFKQRLGEFVAESV